MPRTTTTTVTTTKPDLLDMTLIPGGTFKMGSEKYYPEERPVREVTVSGFYIDKFTVTNKAYKKFVDETGYVTVAERPLNPDDYPGALPELLVPGRASVQKRQRDRRSDELLQLVGMGVPERIGNIPQGPALHSKAERHHPVVHSRLMKTRRPKQNGPAKNCLLKPSGSTRRRGGLDGRVLHGATTMSSLPIRRRTPGKANSSSELIDRQV
jgi:formylglycine-generating enzyme required for sulfatase activity